MSYTAETISGEVTQYIPLTTTWTASSDCSRSFRQDGPSLVAFDPGYGLGIDSAVICQPPAVTTWWNQGLLGGGAADHTAVSIMPMTCPAGWSTVVTSVKDGVSTLAMCCPSGYYLANGVSGEVMGDCLSNVQRGMTLTYAWTSTSTDDWRIGTTTMTSSSTVGAIAVVGWNVKRTAVTATSSSTSSSTSSTVPAQTSSATPTGAAEMISDTATAASSITADSSEPLSSTTTASPSITESSSVAPSSLSSISSSNLDSSSSTAPSPSPTSTTTSTPPATTSTSTSLKLGIGLGASLGAIGVLALIIATIILFRRRRSDSRTDIDQNLPRKPENAVGETNRDTDINDRKRQQAFHAYELPAAYERVAAELGPRNFDEPVEMGDGRKSYRWGL